MKETEHDEQTAREMNAISQMIEFSQKEGLLTEVIFTLLHSISKDLSDKTIERECWSAMQEWDI